MIQMKNVNQLLFSKFHLKFKNSNFKWTPKVSVKKSKIFTTLFKSNSKYLEPIDIVDISIAYNVLKREKLVDLIFMLFFKEDKIDENEMLFPMSLYKAFILYEDFKTFEYLRNVEKKFPNRCIYELLKYSISCSSLMFTFYFSKSISIKEHKVAKEIVKELLKSIGSSKIYLEQKLHIIEQLVGHFSFDEVELFNSIVKTYYEVEDTDRFQFDCEELCRIKCINSCPFLYVSNPVKICVILLKIFSKLIHKFNINELNETYCDLCKLCTIFISNTESCEEVSMMLKDKTYSCLEIVDIIGFCKIDMLLENDKVYNFITDIWVGPYERESIIYLSTIDELIISEKESHENNTFK